MISRLSRVARMSAAEIAWRTKTAARILVEEASITIRRPRWNRRSEWRDIARRVAQGPQRFVIDFTQKDALAARIRRDFPDSAGEAIARADRILAGDYDLLGYRGLRFSPPARPAPPALPDWHLDPVHGKRVPARFWRKVAYLDPSCGDHKIIWELNRHQHWLTLGRAYWLTGDTAYRDRFVAELESWLAANPPLIGVNWASMLELAFRTLSWIWALHLFGDGPWAGDLLLGIDRQLTHIEQHLSRYFSPNTHLTGEALALYVAGQTLPQLGASRRRAAIGRRVLVEEIDRQIAADGGHCERSPHYHRYTLDFYLLARLVAERTNDPAAADFERGVDRLASAARLLADDNGRLPHIGDDDGGMLFPMTGRAPDDVRDSLTVAAHVLGRNDLAAGAAEEALWLLGERHEFPTPHSRFQVLSSALPETGYYVSRSGRGDHIVIDGGPHGYQNGGHAHADALSLTATLGGVPFLIDPGTFCYTVDLALRDRIRSSAMHNTVTVDGRSQSQPNGPFHWSQTADASVRRWTTRDDADYFEAEHNGYAPLVHRRHVLVRHGDLFVVADLIAGDGVHTAAVHWHVHPQWNVVSDGSRVRFAANGATVELVVPHAIIETFAADAVTGLGWYSPAYGRVEPATTVRATRQGETPFWIANVFGLDAANPIAAVEWVAERTLRIARARTTEEISFTDQGPRTRAQGQRTKDRLCAASLAS